MSMRSFTLHTLPGGVVVAQRDWLSANHVLLNGDTGRVIIDTGYITQAHTTRACIEATNGELALDLIVNTHCHSDHMGCNAYLQRWTHASIAIPEGERHAIESWDERKLWLDYADQQCERFTPDMYLHPEQTVRWGNLDWDCIAARGHDDGTLVFYNPDHRILISADALWERGFGFVPPRAWDAGALGRTRETLNTLAALSIDWVIPGHGAPFQDATRALEQAYARLSVLEQDDTRVARQMAKAMFIFSTMACGRLAVSDLVGYVQRIECLRDLNAQFLRFSPEAFAQWLVDEAVATGNIEFSDKFLVAR
jgi:glyoxylase-like metal-dependent hydrolase (beta-lactamase superfamily II)